MTAVRNSGERRARLLLVDDHRDSVEMYAEYLAISGFDVCVSFDVDTACRTLETDPPDLVVTDLSMPQADGWDLIERLRECRAAGVNIPIIVLSAHAFPDVRERAEAAGVMRFLTKPCLPEDLTRAVVAVLERVREGCA